MQFTDKYIANLKPEGKQYIQREARGFAIRVLPTGQKTWLFIYTFDGRRRQMNLGTYCEASEKDKAKPKVIIGLADARTAHAAAYAMLNDPTNPRDPQEQRDQKHEAERLAREEIRKAPTVATLITEYIEKHAKPNKRGWAEDERILKRDALPAWGDRKVAEIKKRDVVLLLESIVERGSPGSANNNFKVIRKMFRFAVQRDILEHSPCDGVVMPAPLNRGDRVLSETEIKALWHNLDTCHVSDEIRRALKLILASGQRPGEVIGMHISEIDGRWWTIPIERSKNKRAHRVYLTDTALELVGPLKITDTKTGKEADKGFIFPSPRVPIDPVTEKPILQPIAVNALAHVVRRNAAVPVMVKGKPVYAKDGKPVTENKLEVADFTPHDLRRTAATFMSQLGILDEVIDAVLNHTKQGIIRTYNLNRYDKEKQAALEAWERKLKSITTGAKGASVTPISAGRKKGGKAA